MGLGAGEVHERRAVGVGLHGAQVHLEPAAELYGSPGLPLRDDFRHLAVRGEPVHHLGAVFPVRRDDDVQVPDGLAPPPVAPRDLDLRDAPARLEIRDDRGGLYLRFVE